MEFDAKTKSVIEEIEGQRNQALTRAAFLAGVLAELQEKYDQIVKEREAVLKEVRKESLKASIES